MHRKLEALQANLNHVIHGKEQATRLLTTALAAAGSVLIQDVPGVGKTTLAKALATSIHAHFQRIQFTPDLLPADILGGSVYNPVNGEFTFRKGPIFTNILLADEINRASPRTQSALLEAMNEAQATIEGQPHPLPAPFLVVATQNPVEYHGTYPLPEAQLDRFLMLLRIGYPDSDTEVNILYSHSDVHPLEALGPVVTRDEIVAIQSAVRQVRVDEAIAAYIVTLVDQTRQDPALRLGVAPRGALMLFRAAQAAAFVAGRDFVLPDDVQDLAVPVLAHRIVLTSKAKYGGQSQEQVVQSIVERTEVPM